MTTTAAPATTPFRFFDVHVVRTRRLGPSMVRITFGGERLGELASGGRDQRFKLFLPQAHQSEPVFADQGENWYPAWRAQDPAERPLMRSYTIREQRHEPAEVDVDFALHGADAPGGAAGGPASRWAAAAVPGDRVSILGPAVEDNGGVDFRPPPGTDWILLTGDETALPAVAGILAWLSPAPRPRSSCPSPTRPTARTCPPSRTPTSPGSSPTSVRRTARTPSSKRCAPPSCPRARRTPGSRARRAM